MLAPVLFNIFINDVDDGTEQVYLSNFADDTELGGVLGVSDGCVTI